MPYYKNRRTIQMSMKRILSGFLALVLLLGSVPVTALADETLPEETLAAVAEETAAAETTVLVTEAVTEATTEETEITEPAETTAATEPEVIETEAPTEPAVVETTEATEPAVETTVATEPEVAETTEVTEPVAETTEPVIIETEAPTEPAVEETVPEETAPEETVEATEEVSKEAANASSGVCGGSVFWSYNEDTATLTITGSGEIGDYNKNNRPWAAYEDSIETVVVGDRITSIGNYAFYGCSALTTVELAETVFSIPGHVTTLNNGIFYGCDSLTTVTLEEGVQTIGRYAFEECSALKTVTIPASVVTIGFKSFDYCYLLRDIYYGGDYDQWEDIDGHDNAEYSYVTIHKTPKGSCGEEATWAFDESTGTLTISGKGETSEWNFNSNSPTQYNHPWKDLAGSITKVVVEEGITVLGGRVFYQHTALKSVTLPDSLTAIYGYAFYKCEKITKIEIPEGVTTINNYAFGYCTALKSVTVPASVTTIGWNAFEGCDALTDIYYGSTKAAWERLSCASYEPCKSATIHTTPAGICGENLTWDFNASTGVLTIQGQGEMYDYDNWSYGYRAPWYDYAEQIKTVTVKSGVTSIGEDAFGKYSSNDANYSRLTKVTLPATLTAIGQEAFSSCTALSSISIPAKVTSIGDYAFSGCTALTTVTLKKGLTTIGSYAFYECTKLRSITIPASVTEIGRCAFYACTKLDTVTLYNGLKTIGAYAFSGCNRLATISIPASVTSIGEGAFNGCKAMTKVTIPAGITTIEPSTFEGTGITQITIPASVTTIGNRAFESSALTSVTVPATVTSLGEYVFAYCDYLTTATLPKGMTAIPKGTFCSCDRLTKVTIPATVTEIEPYAFQSCNTLTSITLPTKLTTISESAFQSCWRLQEIVIPKNVELIDYKAFAYCNDLKLIHFKGNAPTMYGDTFLDVTADVIYPRKNSTWNSGARQNYGGELTWTVSYPLSVSPRVSDGKPQLTWGKVTGAKKYHIYRSTRANGGWSKLTTTTATSYVNTGATYGKTYYYKVTTVFNDGTQATSRIMSCNSVLPAPKITVTKNNNGNPVIKWQAVKNAGYYEICRISEEGHHSYYGTSELRYVDKDAEAGMTYQYQVLAYPRDISSDYRSQYCNPVTYTVPLEKPAITLSNVASSGKIKISWSAVPHAVKYQVWRATSKDGKYTRIATTTATSLTNANAEVGKTYYYKVKAIHAKTSANSPFSAIKSRMCDLPAPQITVELNANGKPKISWNKVEGTVKYQVWRATSKNGTYTRLTTTTNLSMVNKNAVAGKTYYYKVRAVYSNTNANSAFSSIKSIQAK